MKTDNLVIFIAFIIGVIILSLSFKKDVEKTFAEQDSTTVFSFGNKENADKEKNALLEKIKILEAENQQYKQIFAQSNNSFVKSNTLVPVEKPFGTYHPFIPYIKALAEYAKWHTIPITNPREFKELTELDKSQKIRGISLYEGMNIIDLSDGYYIKLLQNTVAIYRNNTWYHIDFALDGQATCVGKKTEGYQSCQKLGGTNPTPNNRIPWIAYKLPNNLFD